MGIPEGFDLEHGLHLNACGTLGHPTATSIAVVAYGRQRGRGTNFYLSPDIIGKTFIVTDNKSTTTTAKTCTFARANFANAAQPTLAEVVTAINAAFDEATDTDASSGAVGELIVTGAAAGTDSTLTIGAGTANPLLGFPGLGVTTLFDNAAATIEFTLPATFGGVGFGNEWLYTRNPRVSVSVYDPATGVLTAEDVVAEVSWTWTPSTRKFVLLNIEAAAKVVNVHVVL